MKKAIIIPLIVVLVIVCAIFFVGGNKKNNSDTNNISKGSKYGLDLKLDFKHMNGKVYNAHFNLTADDNITELDEEEPENARIENEKENYVLDISLETEAKEAYEQYKTSAKEDNEIFEEVKFGKYEGYYSNDKEDIYGYILLDDSDETFNAYVMFSLYSYDDSSEGNDMETIYKSSTIQNILNNIEFKVSK